jgi:hypothetical protein
VISSERSFFRIKPLIFLFKILRELALKKARNQFQQLKPKYVAYPIQWGICCKLLIAVSQPADSGNRLAAIVSTAGISLPLQFN